MKKCAIFDFGGVISGIYFGNIVPGIIQEISRLSINHLLFVVSASETSTINLFLKKHNLSNHFTEIFGFDSQKDKTDQILNILQTYNLLSENTVMITDTARDIISAHKAGIKGVGVLWGIDRSELLNNAKPELIVKTPDLLAKSINTLTESAR